MNPIIENIGQRRSIRKYKPKRLPKKLIEAIIEAGRYAPSSHNSQPWRFIVIENKEEIRKLSGYIQNWFRKRLILGRFFGIFNKRIKQEIESAKKRIAGQDLFFYNAPLLVLVCAQPGRFSLQDCSLAGENMMLAARSLGIGSCWIGFADMVVNQDRRLMAKLGVPPNHKIMAHLIFGYPVKFPEKACPRKEEADIIRWTK